MVTVDETNDASGDVYIYSEENELFCDGYDDEAHVRCMCAYIYVL